MRKMLICAYFAISSLLLLPSISLYFFYSHGLAKASLVLLFLYILFKSITNNASIRIPPLFSYLILFYLCTQALSIIHVQNINEFVTRFISVSIAIVFFYTTNILSKNNYPIKKTFTYSLFLVASISSIMMIVIFTIKDTSIPIFELIFHPGLVDMISMNLERGRIYLETNNESILPLLFMNIYQNINLHSKFFYFSLGQVIVLLSFLSGFRTRVLMVIAAIMINIAMNGKRHIIPSLLYIIFIGSIVSILFILSNSFSFTTIVDRFLLRDEIQDVQTIVSRKEQFEEAIEVSRAFPLTGSGLGNYYVGRPYNPYLNSYEREINDYSQLPHNIFAQHLGETGILGLVSIVLLFVYFVIRDYNLIHKSNSNKKIFVFCFWTLVISGLFNPTNLLNYQVLFWGYRAIIED